MIQEKKGLDWSSYAKSYDLLLSYNPFYQALQEDILQNCRAWQIEPDDLIIDLGAGTGNYSLPIAQFFPAARVLHIEPNEGMNTRTREKIASMGLENVSILPSYAEEVKLSTNSVSACVCIHAFYTFKDPVASIQNIYRWLKPGGMAVLVDAGRKVRVIDWQIAIGWHLISTYGLKKALEIMQSGKEVSKQNAYIRKKQNIGEYWLHSHEEFVSHIKEAGFEILEAKKTFRGVSDFVVVRK
ncbi:MAG: methyltransferase domain-containing protein [Bacteroidota bacterium]